MKYILATAITVAFMVGCGGGGGGSSGGGGLGIAPSSVTTLAPFGSVPIAGKVTFDFVPVAVTAGTKLDYSNIAIKPARSIAVSLIDSVTGAELATTKTDALGNYSFTGPENRAVFVRAYARLLPVNASTTARVSVLDNTNFDAQWALDGAVFTAANSTALTKSLNAGSGWTGAAYNDSQRIAGTFAMLDTIYTGMQKVIAVDATAAFPKLDVHWSPNNVTASPLTGPDFATGQIGTSFFREASTGGVVSSRDLYILGRANNDTDEYDQHVVAHEFGHYLQSAFSRDDSIGGRHGGPDDRLDMRVAFSEGWGNGWAGYSLGNPVYSDTAGPNQATGGSFNVSIGELSNKGWFKEASVERIIWDLSNSASIGFGPVWDSLKTGFASSPALTSAHSFANALRLRLTAGAAQTALASIFNSELIAIPTDAYGTGETNFGSPAIAGISPIYTTYGALGSISVVCVNNFADSVGVGNKAGQHRYIRFNLATSGARTITVTRSPTTTVATDPDFSVYDSTGIPARFEDTTANLETAPGNPPAGDYVIALTDYNFRTSLITRETCFSVVIK